MNEDDVFYPSYSTSTECPYLTSEEDHWGTTSYPKCTCGCVHCNEYGGYCPIRDDNK